MGSGIGYQSPYKRYDRPEIACWGFGCSNSEERMCKYECDERVPRDEVKVRISNFFGVSVQELFFN